MVILGARTDSVDPLKQLRSPWRFAAHILITSSQLCCLCRENGDDLQCNWVEVSYERADLLPAALSYLIPFICTSPVSYDTGVVRLRCIMQRKVRNYVYF